MLELDADCSAVASQLADVSVVTGRRTKERCMHTHAWMSELWRKTCLGSILLV